MRYLLLATSGLVLNLSLVFGTALLTSCAASYEVPAATAGPLDSTLRAAGLSPAKVKFTGPVTLQIGGSHNTATAQTKPRGPVASAPHAVATDASKKGRPPWWVLAAIGVGSIAAWEWLTKQLAPVSWLPWRKS